MHFFMPMKIPTTTHQQKQVRVVKGKPIFYEPADLQQARADLTDHLAQFKPKEPLHGDIQLVVKWCFPLIEGSQDGEFKHTKPDLDNLMKLLQDCMNSLDFFDDDRYIVSLVTEKFWAKIPGIYIELQKIEPIEEWPL